MDGKIEIMTGLALPQLISQLEEGHIKVPMFQRGFEWERARTVLLLNSIYLQYPIGTFFFWSAPADYSAFVRPVDDIPDTRPGGGDGNFLFILDGQQRLLSLYRSTRGTRGGEVDYTQICFNPQRRRFLVPRGRAEKHNIEAYKLFDDLWFRTVEARLAGESEKLAEAWREARALFDAYPVSAVKAEGFGIDDIVEIFERINQGGKRLSSFDLVHAATWGSGFDLKERIREYNGTAKARRAGGLEEKVFTYSLAMNAYGDCRPATQLKLTPAVARDLWPRTRAALNKALDFLASMSIQGDTAPYQTHLVVLQHLFFRRKDAALSEGQRREIEKWFWDARLNKRYSTLPHTRVKDDAQWILGLE